MLKHSSREAEEGAVDGSEVDGAVDGVCMEAAG
jgi:hypothetical protein